MIGLCLSLKERCGKVSCCLKCDESFEKTQESPLESPDLGNSRASTWTAAGCLPPFGLTWGGDRWLRLAPMLTGGLAIDGLLGLAQVCV